MPDEILRQDVQPGQSILDALPADKINALQRGVLNLQSAGNIQTGAGLRKGSDTGGNVTIALDEPPQYVPHNHPFKVYLEREGSRWKALIMPGAFYILSGSNKRYRPHYADIHTAASVANRTNSISVNDGDFIYAKISLKFSEEFAWDIDEESNNPITILSGSKVPDDNLPEPEPILIDCAGASSEASEPSDEGPESGDLYLPICKVTVGSEIYTSTSSGIPYAQDLCSDAFLAPYEPPTEFEVVKPSTEDTTTTEDTGGGRGGRGDGGDGGGGGGGSNIPDNGEPAPMVVLPNMVLDVGFDSIPGFNSRVKTNLVTDVYTRESGENCVEVVKRYRENIIFQRGQLYYKSLRDVGQVNYKTIYIIEGDRHFDPEREEPLSHAMVKCGRAVEPPEHSGSSQDECFYRREYPPSQQKPGEWSPLELAKRDRGSGGQPGLVPAPSSEDQTKVLTGKILWENPQDLIDTNDQDLSYTTSTGVINISDGSSIRLPLADESNPGLIPALTTAGEYFDGAGNYSVPDTNDQDLSYTTSTGDINISDGSSTRLPLADESNPGLSPARSGNASEYMDGSGDYSTPNTNDQDLSYTTSTGDINISDGSSTRLPLADESNPGLSPARSGNASEYMDGSGDYSIPNTNDQDLSYTTSTREINISDGSSIRLPLATTTVEGMVPALTTAGEYFDGAGKYSVPETNDQDLSYTTSTRDINISDGSSTRLPLADESNPGLSPARSGNANEYMDGSGDYSTPNTNDQDLSYTTSTGDINISDGSSIRLPLADESNPGLSPARSGNASEYMDGSGDYSTPNTNDQDLSYNAATRTVEITDGTNAMIALATTTVEGMISTLSGDTNEFFRADGSFSPVPPPYTVSDSTAVNMTLASGDLSAAVILSTTADNQIEVAVDGLRGVPQDLNYVSTTRKINITDGASTTIPLATTNIEGFLTTLSGNANEFFRGDGAFAQPADTNTTYEVFDTSTDGLVPRSVNVSDRVLTDGGLWKVTQDLIDTNDQDLSYNAETRAINISDGASTIIPLATTNIEGFLTTLSGNANEFFRGDGAFAQPADTNTTYEVFDTSTDGLVPRSVNVSDRVLTDGGLWKVTQDLIDTNDQDLSYNAETRAINISDGASTIIPLATTNIEGFLTTLSGNANEFFRGDGAFAQPADTNTTYEVFDTSTDGLVPRSVNVSDRVLTDGGLWKVTQDLIDTNDQDLSYNAETRAINISDGASTIIPLATTNIEGFLTTLSGNANEFFRGDGAFAQPADTNTTYEVFDTSTDGLVPRSVNVSDRVLTDRGLWENPQDLIDTNDQDLSYTSTTRKINISDGAGTELPLADASNPGLIPAHPSDATKYFDGTGAFSTPPDTDTTYEVYDTATDGLVPQPGSVSDRVLTDGGLWKVTQDLIDTNDQDLSYNAETRAINISDGASATIPLATTTIEGFLTTLSGNTNEFFRGDGAFAQPPDTNTTYEVFDPTTNGLVPQPGSISDRVLTDGGLWKDPQDLIDTNDQDLSYTSATRTINISDGAATTLPLADASNPGLTPAFPDNTSDFLRADRTFAQPPDTDTTYEVFDLATDGLVPRSVNVYDRVLTDGGLWKDTQDLIDTNDQDLSYTSTTRKINISDGAGAELPLHTSTTAGLIPAHPDNANLFYDGSRNWSAYSVKDTSSMNMTLAGKTISAAVKVSPTTGNIFQIGSDGIKVVTEAVPEPPASGNYNLQTFDGTLTWVAVQLTGRGERQSP